MVQVAVKDGVVDPHREVPGSLRPLLQAPLGVKNLGRGLLTKTPKSHQER